jgi:hypothetical protein
MKKLMAAMIVGAITVLSFTVMGKEATLGTTLDTQTPRVQLAILLDTSNSMDGLIGQAKSQLWRIVNQFATAVSAYGLKPYVEVSLYQYGTPSLGAETGYIKQLLPLTTDLDKVSEELFALKTDGGDEYCGTVIQAAVRQLQWSRGKHDYKAIFIAGNEPFTQGNVDFHLSSKAAAASGIIVNTIFCGANGEGIATNWKDGADLADGSYFSIDQNQKIVNLTTPFDRELAELNGKLNQTYLAYGAKGQAGLERQRVQDENAVKLSPSVAAARAVTKASSNYHNSTWDLLDAVKDNKVNLAKIEKEELPAELQKLTVEQRKTYVETKTKEREAVQEKIGKLSRDRDAYIAAKQKNAATGAPSNTLDTAIIKAIKEQATRANFQFDK